MPRRGRSQWGALVEKNVEKGVENHVGVKIEINSFVILFPKVLQNDGMSYLFQKSGLYYTLQSSFL